MIKTTVTATLCRFWDRRSATICRQTTHIAHPNFHRSLVDESPKMHIHPTTHTPLIDEHNWYSILDTEQPSIIRLSASALPSRERRSPNGTKPLDHISAMHRPLRTRRPLNLLAKDPFSKHEVEPSTKTFKVETRSRYLGARFRRLLSESNPTREVHKKINK